jgi:hypothetical protein
MNDNLMFDYLLEMGAMRPEQEELRRKQAMVDALRGRAMEPLQGQMVGKHYVAPGIANAVAQMGTAYMAGKQQKGVDTAMAGMNERQGSTLRRMQEMQRRKRLGLTNVTGEMDTGDYGGGM